MSRISEVHTGLIARAAHSATKRQVGRTITPIGAMAHVPRLLLGYGALEKAFAASHQVDERLKALAVLKSAAMIGCEFCVDIGSWEARASGLSDEQLLALPGYADSDLFSPLEKLVLDFAVAMTRTPPDVDDDLFTRLREHFDEPQIVELAMTVALENLRSRFNQALGIGSAGFSEGMVCAIPETLAHAAGGS